jgi:Ca2+/Na+ antiporter
MNFDQFGCERRLIETVHREVQRNVLIQEYCGDNFGSINLVDFYYRNTEQNAILMFMFIVLVFPLLFMCVAAIADKYLATGMQDLSIRFGLSPSLAAVTLIAFANGAPDVLSSLSAGGKEGGMFIAIGSTFGAYIFSACLVISNVALAVKEDIQLPKMAVLKEFSFYLLSVTCVCVFGLMKTAGYGLMGTYLGIYIIYLITTVILEKYAKKDEEIKNENDLEGKLEAEENKDEEKKEDEIKEDPEKNETNDKIENEEIKEGDIEKKKSENEEEKEKGFLQKIIDEITDEEASLLETLVLMPLLFAGMFTVCYLDNPFMKINFLKFLIIASSLTFFITMLELTPFDLLINCGIGLGFGVLCMILELAKFSQNVLDIIYEFISVFAAIGWISIFSGIIIDFISFLAFYFSINEIILSSLLLSAGNTVGDYFGNAALAKAGEPVMGALAAYSGVIFNNFIGFSINVFSSATIDDTNFDIFALDYYKSEDADVKPPPYGNYFLMMVIATVVTVNVVSLTYYWFNNFVLSKKITPVLFVLYAGFFVGSLIFGVLSRT